MKIIVDAFGGDNAPLEIIKGSVMAIEEYGFEVTLVGNEKKIKIEIVHSDEILTMDDNAESVVKSKKGSSMAVGLKLLSDGKGDAFISAGNSGALVAGATLIVKRIKGIRRCAFAPIMPKNKGFFMLIDSGANVECSADMLYQFGLMGSLYMKKVMGIEKPRIGLANVGVEDHKGTKLQNQTFMLLKDSELNFIGNIEAREITNDACDVVVSDGFTGNIILKMYEGVAITLLDKIKDMFNKNLKNKLAAAFILSDIKKLKKETDYNEYGGSPIIGIKKPVFKAHGSAKAKTFKNALKLTAEYVKNNVIEELTDSIKK